MIRAKLVTALVLATLLGGAQPAAATTCNLGPYIVFFSSDRAYLDQRARQTLDSLLGAIGNCGYARTLLAGHSDGAEDPAVVETRLTTIIAYLAAHGIPRDDISAEDFGDSRPRVPGATGEDRLQNMRVEITFGPFEPE